MWLQFTVVAVFGAGTGFAELVTRYRDSTQRLLCLLSTWAYLLTNAAASAGALGVAIMLHWTFGLDDRESIIAIRAVVCGFGAMFLLRSAFVTVQHDGQEVSIGPSGIVGAVLEAMGRTINRHQARYRSIDVTPIMRGISFDKSKDVLSAYTIRLMERVSQAELARVADEIDKLQEEEGTDQAKAFSLGVILIRLAGVEVLKDAVDTLRDEISAVVPPVDEAVATRLP